MLTTFRAAGLTTFKDLKINVVSRVPAKYFPRQTNLARLS